VNPQGDPQVVAAPVFVVASICLGFQLTTYSGTAFGAPLAAILMGAGVFLLLSTIWAAAVGQSFVAAFAGTFGGFWLSYGVFVLALIHGWFGANLHLGDPAASLHDITHAVAGFTIAWAAFFTILTLTSMRLPAIYPAIFGLVVVALCLVATAVLFNFNVDLLKAAGIVVFVFAGLGMMVSWTVLNLSLAGPLFPPLGPVMIKPKAAPPAE
jgi:uncharacterized protein